MIELHCGDCLELMEAIPEHSVDMAMCDLPYGTTSCTWDSVIPLKPLWEQYRRIVTPNAALVFTANQPFSSALVSSAYDLFKYSWVWVKNRPQGLLTSKNRPMGKHEDILVFSLAPMGHVSQLHERRMTYNPQGVTDGKEKVIKAKGFRGRHVGARPNQVGKKYISQTGFPHTVLEFAKDESHLHPTQKPVALIEYLIRTYTNEGDTVLDNCMGSGTTGVACVNTRRSFIGIEISEEYLAIARERIERAELLV